MAGNFIKEFRFEPFAISPLVDATGHYELKLDPEFPFSIKLFSYATLDPAVRLNWHNRLEIFIPVAGSGVFRMGERELAFDAGDVLVVDNLKLHGLSSFQGRRRHAVVISFKAELFYHLGSPLCDFFYLTPFFNQDEANTPVLRATDALATQVNEALKQLLDCYFHAPDDACFKSGCKSWLAVILYLLARRASGSATARDEYAKRREQAHRLGALVNYLDQNYAEKVAVAQAASMVGMSKSRFMNFFKQATGMTFVNYLTHLRVTKAHELLRDQHRSIAEVAALTGFNDQSYFDKKFKQHFGKTPREYRGARRRLMPPTARRLS